MRMIGRLFVVAAGLVFLTSPAVAQSMTPMRGEVKSYSDSFAIQVHPFNPYDHRIKVVVRVYDENFRELPARVSPGEMMLAGGASRRVIVRIGFDGTRERKVRVCTESIPFPQAQQIMKAQICGRFLARRML